MFTQPRSGRKNLLQAAAAFSISALLLTGCSASADNDAGATSETEEGPISMTVARGQVNIENTILAEENGIFEDAGIIVDP